MKTLNKLFATGGMVFLLMLMAPHKSMAQDDGYVSDQEFYDQLQQYGTWVQDDQYGDVWVPDVDGDFRPYATNGYWVQTDYGTTWVSDYPWGWATFHYGRWRYDDYYGWEWVPGHEWAPAWVSWRQGGGYYGWAPMGPGISITLSLGGIGLNINNDYWVYAPQRYITSRYINRYYAPRTQISIIIRKTTYIHNTYVRNNRTYIIGPRPADIQKITRRKVTVYKINNASRPGAFHVEKNAINIYRPAIKKAPDARPVRVVSATAYKNEHPTEGIGRKGAIGYNHGNAGKLASAARTDKPDGKVVRVNPRKEEPKSPNKPNEPAANNPVATSGGHKAGEPKANPAVPKGGKGHHRTTPTTTQPEKGAVQPQPAVNEPAEPQGNAPAQPEPTSKPEKHQHKAPAVTPPAQNNTDQAKRSEQQQQQARDLALQQKQQAAEIKRQQQQQEQQTKAAAQQQRAQQQQQAQQARQQQQQEQQAARQQAQQQKLQQQQAQQAAKQQAQQQKLQQQQQAKQQAREQKKQEEQQKQNPPRN